MNLHQKKLMSAHACSNNYYNGIPSIELGHMGGGRGRKTIYWSSKSSELIVRAPQNSSFFQGYHCVVGDGRRYSSRVLHCPLEKRYKRHTTSVLWL
ncbi:hypothetical protein SRHO_G00088840 [Serrasalmus rhombeus]